MSYSDTFWLTLANIGLGLVVLICCLLIGREIFGEVLAALHRRAQRDRVHVLRFPLFHRVRRVR